MIKGVLLFAYAATAAAGDGLLTPAWPATLGALAAFIRFALAPVTEEMIVYVKTSVAACIGAFFYSKVVSGASYGSVVLLKAGHPWAIAILALGYGLILGVALGVGLARALRRSADPELQKMLFETALSPFAGSTSRERTHLGIIAVAIVLIILLIVMIEGWWRP